LAIKASARVTQWTLAVALLDRLRNEGLTPDANALKGVSRAFVAAGKVGKHHIDWLDEMCDLRLAPSNLMLKAAMFAHQSETDLLGTIDLANATQGGAAWQLYAELTKNEAPGLKRWVVTMSMYDMTGMDLVEARLALRVIFNRVYMGCKAPMHDVVLLVGRDRGRSPSGREDHFLRAQLLQTVQGMGLAAACHGDDRIIVDKSSLKRERLKVNPEFGVYVAPRALGLKRRSRLAESVWEHPDEQD